MTVIEQRLDPPDNPCEFCIYWDECNEKEACIKRENYEILEEEYWESKIGQI